MLGNPNHKLPIRGPRQIFLIDYGLAKITKQTKVQ
jgi:hypothetical protein